MEYLVDMVTTVPQGTSSLKVDELHRTQLLSDDLSGTNARETHL
jgi:hypothetical protein